MTAYYNDNDPVVCQWLRELIKAGEIAPGEVDERSILDVEPKDLVGFTQSHFFAGVGGWSRALRLAGWPDDRPVWTGSPPCQPFSCAGRGLGVKDERHLAPHFLSLVKTGRPAWIFGEQVAAAVKKDNWLDDLLDVLEDQGYTTGAAVTPACGLGAPHIRQRLWFVGRLGHTINEGSQGLTGDGNNGSKPGRLDTQQGGSVTKTGSDSRLADTASEQDYEEQQRPAETEGGWCSDSPCGCDTHSRLADTQSGGWREEQQDSGRCGEGTDSQRDETGGSESSLSPDSQWGVVDWLFCRDGKWRPAKPGIQPLAHRLPRGMVYSCDPGDAEYANNTQEARVMRLKGYGNAIVPQVAAEIIMEVM